MTLKTSLKKPPTFLDTDVAIKQRRAKIKTEPETWDSAFQEACEIFSKMPEGRDFFGPEIAVPPPRTSIIEQPRRKLLPISIESLCKAGGNVNRAEVNSIDIDETPEVEREIEITLTERKPAMRTAGDENVIDDVEPDAYEIADELEQAEQHEQDDEQDDDEDDSEAA
jgi:hypothetical protein